MGDKPVGVSVKQGMFTKLKQKIEGKEGSPLNSNAKTRFKKVEADQQLRNHTGHTRDDKNICDWRIELAPHLKETLDQLDARSKMLKIMSGQSELSENEYSDMATYSSDVEMVIGKTIDKLEEITKKSEFSHSEEVKITVSSLRACYKKIENVNAYFSKGKLIEGQKSNGKRKLEELTVQVAEVISLLTPQNTSEDVAMPSTTQSTQAKIKILIDKKKIINKKLKKLIERNNQSVESKIIKEVNELIDSEQVAYLECSKLIPGIVNDEYEAELQIMNVDVKSNYDLKVDGKSDLSKQLEEISSHLEAIEKYTSSVKKRHQESKKQKRQTVVRHNIEAMQSLTFKDPDLESLRKELIPLSDEEFTLKKNLINSYLEKQWEKMEKFNPVVECIINWFQLAGRSEKVTELCAAFNGVKCKHVLNIDDEKFLKNMKECDQLLTMLSGFNNGDLGKYFSHDILPKSPTSQDYVIQLMFKTLLAEMNKPPSDIDLKKFKEMDTYLKSYVKARNNEEFEYNPDAGDAFATLAGDMYKSPKGITDQITSYDEIGSLAENYHHISWRRGDHELLNNTMGTLDRFIHSGQYDEIAGKEEIQKADKALKKIDELSEEIKSTADFERNERLKTARKIIKKVLIGKMIPNAFNGLSEMKSDTVKGIKNFFNKVNGRGNNGEGGHLAGYDKEVEEELNSVLKGYAKVYITTDKNRNMDFSVTDVESDDEEKALNNVLKELDNGKKYSKVKLSLLYDALENNEKCIESRGGRQTLRFKRHYSKPIRKKAEELCSAMIEFEEGIEVCRCKQDKYKKEAKKLQEDEDKNKQAKGITEKAADVIDNIKSEKLKAAVCKYQKEQERKLRSEGVGRFIPKSIHSLLIKLKLVDDPKNDIDKNRGVKLSKSDSEAIEKIKKVKELILKSDNPTSLALTSKKLSECYTQTASCILEGVISHKKGSKILDLIASAQKISAGSHFTQPDSLALIDVKIPKNLTETLASNKENFKKNLKILRSIKFFKGKEIKLYQKNIENDLVALNSIELLMNDISSNKISKKALAEIIQIVDEFCNDKMKSELGEGFAGSFKEVLQGYKNEAGVAELKEDVIPIYEIQEEPLELPDGLWENKKLISDDYEKNFYTSVTSFYYGKTCLDSLRSVDFGDFENLKITLEKKVRELNAAVVGYKDHLELIKGYMAVTRAVTEIENAIIKNDIGFITSDFLPSTQYELTQFKKLLASRRKYLELVKSSGENMKLQESFSEMEDAVKSNSTFIDKILSIYESKLQEELTKELAGEGKSKSESSFEVKLSKSFLSQYFIIKHGNKIEKRDSGELFNANIVDAHKLISAVNSEKTKGDLKDIHESAMELIRNDPSEYFLDRRRERFDKTITLNSKTINSLTEAVQKYKEVLER